MIKKNKEIYQYIFYSLYMYISIYFLFFMYIIPYVYDFENSMIEKM